MKSKIQKPFFYALIILSGLAMSTGCRKKKDTLVIVYVKDSSNMLVSGAQVVLYGNSSTGQQADVTLYDTLVTNSSGEAKFNFNDVYQLGQAGVAVLNIKVYKEGLMGSGIIKVEQEKTSSETVYL